MRRDNGGGRRTGKDPVYEITGTRRAISADVEARQRRYVISMGVRTACFLLAIVTTGWFRWTFLAGALLLPYIAVVIANAGRERARELPTVAVHEPRKSIEAAPDRTGR